MPDLSFRRMTLDDPVLMHRWLHTPHVYEWFREDYSLGEVREKYVPDPEDACEYFVAQLDGRDFGFMQRYELTEFDRWAQANKHAVPDQEGIVGIDYFIGEPDLVGRGLGTEMIREFCAITFDDDSVQGIISDPQQDNVASCRALEKSGFVAQWTGKLNSDDPSDSGPSVIYLLTR